MPSDYNPPPDQNQSPSRIKRPGISQEWLDQHHICHVATEEAEPLVGLGAGGLLIPYFDARTSQPVFDPPSIPFARMRLDTPIDGRKYHQAASTSIHAFLCLNTFTPKDPSTLVLVEGEFKCLGLADPTVGLGSPVVGLCGFYGFARKHEVGQALEFVDELRWVLDALHPTEVVFIGDNDTALNPQFADAALKLKELLGNIPLRLFRIHLDEPKGIDDVREEKGARFKRWFQERLKEAILVEDQKLDALRLQLLEPEAARIPKLATEDRVRAIERLAKLAQACGSVTQAEILKLVKKHKISGIGEFRSAIEAAGADTTEANVSLVEAQIKKALDEVYYDGKYAHFKDSTGNGFVKVSSRQDILAHLSEGYGLSVGRYSSVSPAERALVKIQKQNSVDFAGRLAGRPAGLWVENGLRILVTAGPIIIPGSQTGDATFIVKFIEELMGSRFLTEKLWRAKVWTFYGWLGYGRYAVLHPQEHCPGQLLVLVGPVDVGKTLLQEKIITPVLGGRSANPAKYLFDRTGFNEDLRGAEHHILTDADIEPDDQSRRKLRDRLKAHVASQTEAYSGKNRSQISIRPIHRISLSVNDDELSVRAIPGPEGGFHDKVIYLKCYPTEVLPQALADPAVPVVNRITDALPAFIGQLESLQLPEDLRDDRFAIAAFHDEEVLRLIPAASDPLRQFEKVLEAFLNAQPGRVIEGSAKQIHSQMLTSAGPEYMRLVQTPTRLGQHLAKLQWGIPGWGQRISKSGTGEYDQQRNAPVLWRITTVGS